MTRFDLAYRDIIADIMIHGAESFNARTGMRTKALPGVTFELHPGLGFPLLTLRKCPVSLFAAEVVWMISGEKNLTFLQQFTPIWNDFAEEDNTIESAYGYRWRHHFGRDQLLDLVTHLKTDKSSRQGVIVMWDPATDGLLARAKKNVPCPFTFTVNIIDEKLNLHLVIRSNDMMLGNPHDIAGFALLQSMLAQELETDVGKLTVSISHAHIYENHYEQAEMIMNRMPHLHEEIQMKLPEKSFQRALKQDKTLVEELVAMIATQYKPMPALKKMKIAL